MLPGSELSFPFVLMEILLIFESCANVTALGELPSSSFCLSLMISPLWPLSCLGCLSGGVFSRCPLSFLSAFHPRMPSASHLHNVLQEPVCIIFTFNPFNHLAM